jgi:hypothetical protein
MAIRMTLNKTRFERELSNMYNLLQAGSPLIEGQVNALERAAWVDGKVDAHERDLIDTLLLDFGREIPARLKTDLRDLRNQYRAESPGHVVRGAEPDTFDPKRSQVPDGIDLTELPDDREREAEAPTEKKKREKWGSS